MKADKQWDEDAVSRSYQQGALDAFKYAQECRMKVHRTDTYKKLHDEYLAQFHVFDYIHGKTFLLTPRQFLAEMRAYLERGVFLPGNQYDNRSYEKYWRQHVTGVIRGLAKDWQ